MKYVSRNSNLGYILKEPTIITREGNTYASEEKY